MSALRSARPTLAMVIAVALASFAGAPRAVRAQVASVPPILAGGWVFDGDISRGVHIVDAAFAPSLAALPEFLQSYGRNRIRSTMGPPRRVDVALSASGIRVTLVAAEVTTTVAGALGAHASTTGVEDGTSVTPQLQAGWLELLYQGENAVMRQLLSTEPDGSHMHLDYHVTNERLRGPVRYRLEYVRAP